MGMNIHICDSKLKSDIKILRTYTKLKAKKAVPIHAMKALGGKEV
jgi:hypothetical protein